MSSKSRCINSGTATMNDRLTKRGYGIMGNKNMVRNPINIYWSYISIITIIQHCLSAHISSLQI